ncbi:MAG: tRNA (adenosine(37)-N6)-dimethylallyltransferase MiaA [Acetobacteraceae bacterium]|nr:tRNA (adenosine(37)-N6)-dimethylallyltransferase MiaA [Acetobacteraceae bacterium]
MTRPRALIVAGPTASGKSALALDLAGELDGAVINADSMQVYRELRILTARPTPGDEARLPHRLYGVRPASQPGSAAWWRGAALAAMDEVREAGRLPILCGGTGLYLSTLVDGIADIPDPSQEARTRARALLAQRGAPWLYARVAEVDPVTAARLSPSDGQRIARAWEVWCSSGRPLSAWLETSRSPAPWRFAAIVLSPPREVLKSAIDARAGAMLGAGALEEVRALLALELDPALPLMRAHGVPELARYLCGDIGLAEAQRRIVQATAQYAKRQATWFRHHVLAPRCGLLTISARYSHISQFSERDMRELQNFLHRVR